MLAQPQVDHPYRLREHPSRCITVIGSNPVVHLPQPQIPNYFEHEPPRVRPTPSHNMNHTLKTGSNNSHNAIRPQKSQEWPLGTTPNTPRSKHLKPGSNEHKNGILGPLPRHKIGPAAAQCSLYKPAAVAKKSLPRHAPETQKIPAQSWYSKPIFHLVRVRISKKSISQKL